MAYNSANNRYFAGKQVKCEFVTLTRWKVAICGEYMKSRLKTCSRGSACNFLHCFTNPGGDYEWADFDKPPPRFWVKKMVALFGYSDDTWHHDKQLEPQSPKDHHRIFTSHKDSYHEKRHRSIEKSQHNSSRSHRVENHVRKNRSREQEKDDNNYKHETKYKNTDTDTDSDREQLDKNTPKRHREGSQSHSRCNRSESKPRDYYRKSKRKSYRSSSDEEDFYKKRDYNKKSKSRNGKNVSELSDDEESDDVELKRRKERRDDDRRLRSRGGDGGSGEMERRRHGGSRSRDGGEEIEMSDRWDPEGDRDDLKNSEQDSKSSNEEVVIVMIKLGKRGREFESSLDRET